MSFMERSSGCSPRGFGLPGGWGNPLLLGGGGSAVAGLAD
jgi:hypothetical protein